jgi:single-strand DNA-binding protein
MKLIGIVRLGRDAESRYTTKGEPACSFSGAYNYGSKGEDGKRPTQWVELTLWGKRAETLAEYLTKGRQVFVVAGDAHVETYEKRDGGTGWKFVGRVDDIQLIGDRQQEGGGAPAAAPAPRAAPAPSSNPPSKSSGTAFDDMDDDIPF